MQEQQTRRKRRGHGMALLLGATIAVGALSACGGAETFPSGEMLQARALLCAQGKVPLDPASLHSRYIGRTYPVFPELTAEITDVATVTESEVDGFKVLRLDPKRGRPSGASSTPTAAATLLHAVG